MVSQSLPCDAGDHVCAGEWACGVPPRKCRQGSIVGCWRVKLLWVCVYEEGQKRTRTGTAARVHCYSLVAKVLEHDGAASAAAGVACVVSRRQGKHLGLCTGRNRESEQCNKHTFAPSPQSHAYYLPASSEPGTSTCSRTLSVGMEEALHTGQVMEPPSS